MVEALCKSRTKEIFWTKMLLSVKKLFRKDLNLFRLRLMTWWLKFTNYFTKLCGHVLPTSINSFNVKSHWFINYTTLNNVSFPNLRPAIQNHKDLGNSFSTLSSDRQNDIEAILQIFNRTHKTFVQDPYILNVVEEFLDYQAFSNHDIPENIWESAKISDNGHQMDVIWDHLKAKFPYLSKIAESVLVVPHSNSIEERVFLIIWKNKTEFRSRLNLAKSLTVFPPISAPRVY